MDRWNANPERAASRVGGVQQRKRIARPDFEGGGWLGLRTRAWGRGDHLEGGVRAFVRDLREGIAFGIAGSEDPSLGDPHEERRVLVNDDGDRSCVDGVPPGVEVPPE